VEIGKLNQRITLLEHRTKIDEIGNHVTKWEELCSMWSMVTIKSLQSSSENTENGTSKEIQTVTFTVRQSSYLLFINSTTHRILFRGQIYNIISVKPDYEHNSYMTISCETRKAGVSDGIC
jgi:SPP1 family predicted phage head-tail adaptor